MNKPVLDATCGSRMIWFNKNNELAIFVDERELDDEWKRKEILQHSSRY